MTTLALAGAGPQSTFHRLAAPGVPGLRVVRVAESGQDGPDGLGSPDAARRQAAPAGAVACEYADLPGGADAVVVATPPALHLREARRALDGSAAVLVEPPLATTLAAADELVAAAAEPGAVLAYGEHLVHAPAVAEAIGARRRLGDLTYMEVRVVEGPPEHDGTDLAAWGGGALVDPGAHAVALALLLAAPDRVVEVAAADLTAAPPDAAGGAGVQDGAGAPAQAGSTGPAGGRRAGRAGPGVDEDATVTLAFASGLRATVQVSWRAAAPVWEAQVASASGAVRLELVPETSVELNGVPLPLAGPPRGLTSPRLHDLGYVAQLAAVAADAAAGRRPRCSAAFGRTVLDVVCAAYAAAGGGRPEPVPFRGARDRTPADLWGDAHTT